ncbi:MAG TPA: hypothetical protein VF794_10650 [Archangium sp.]|jgi:hypothetical protein|uniref:hypothetical protein n=1 Tax=Archangium sp. TaxID=1872627 RepID=UPI002EDB8C65
MKNAEGMDLPAELDRRLKQGVDRLRAFREAVEELDQIADALGPLLGVSRPRRRGKAASPSGPATRTVGAQTPPAKATRPQQTPPPAAPAETEEVPEWRKVFPGLSARVQGRSK